MLHVAAKMTYRSDTTRFIHARWNITWRHVPASARKHNHATAHRQNLMTTYFMQEDSHYTVSVVTLHCECCHITLWVLSHYTLSVVTLHCECCHVTIHLLQYNNMSQKRPNVAARWAGVVNAKPRPLFPRKTNTVPIVQEALWAQGPVWASAENLAPTGIWSPDRPARSESLYRLGQGDPQNVVLDLIVLVHIKMTWSLCVLETLVLVSVASKISVWGSEIQWKHAATLYYFTVCHGAHNRDWLNDKTHRLVPPKWISKDSFHQ